MTSNPDGAAQFSPDFGAAEAGGRFRILAADSGFSTALSLTTSTTQNTSCVSTQLSN